MLITEMEPTFSVHGDFLYIFSLLSTFFIRRQSMDLPAAPPPPPPECTAAQRALISVLRERKCSSSSLYTLYSFVKLSLCLEPCSLP